MRSISAFVLPPLKPNRDRKEAFKRLLISVDDSLTVAVRLGDFLVTFQIFEEQFGD